MATSKVLDLISSCGECPNHVYYSGGRYNCRLTDETVLDSAIVAPFCPLADYPSRTIADMQRTIRVLREDGSQWFDSVLLSYIAGKFGLNILANGRGIIILLKDDSKVEFGLDFVKEIKRYPFEIVFLDADDAKYVLRPDETPPNLYQVVSWEGEEVLQRLQLANR